MGAFSGTCHANGPWKIKGRPSKRFFNVDGDVSTELPIGTEVRIKGQNHKVELSQWFDSGYTYIQIDSPHTGQEGDDVYLANSHTTPAAGVTTTTTTTPPPKETDGF